MAAAWSTQTEARGIAALCAVSIFLMFFGNFFAATLIGSMAGLAASLGGRPASAAIEPPPRHKTPSVSLGGIEAG